MLQAWSHNLAGNRRVWGSRTHFAFLPGLFSLNNVTWLNDLGRDQPLAGRNGMDAGCF